MGYTYVILGKIRRYAIKTKPAFSILLISLLLFPLLFIFSTPSSLSGNPEKKDIVSEDVLGTKTPEIYISGGSGYSGGGMIALASTDEPSVAIGGYDVSGSVDVSIFKADENALLDYLTHDKDGKQIKKSPDTTKFQFISTLKHKITSGYGNESKLLLPIQDTGIWYLRIKNGTNIVNSFVIRSNIGVLTKEGDNEFIFWGQNFKDRRSIHDGSITVYNLLDAKKELATTSFNSEGIARTPLSSDADIALITQGDDKAVVPINLRYLNSGYSYSSFITQKRETKYFIFTDRPLYRPGDTIYFKSILRDDDDAKYSVPTGQAIARIYNNFGDDALVFEKNYSISPDGTISGQYTLPADAKTGYYRLVVSVPGSTKSQSSFNVEFFRKPEYSIDITTAKTELVAGDTSSFTINGSYFSGQSITGQKVKYKIYSGNFYEYEYLLDRTYALGDDYRYGFWGGEILTQGEAVFDQNGEAAVSFDTKIPKAKGRNQVFSIEAEFDNGSGNPSFSRKNVLIYAGEYDIYRKKGNYSTKLGSAYSLPVVLVSHRSTSVTNVALTAKIHRENWVPYQAENQKYPSYNKEEENFPSLSTHTDSSGNAIFTFTPAKVGSYTITVEGSDGRANIISKTFYAYVSSDKETYYTGGNNNELTIQTDKQKYEPEDTVHFSITSTIADRDIFLSLERGRLNRFQIVHLIGKNTTVDVPLVSTDMPNIYAKVSSFSDQSLDDNSVNVIVSAERKRITMSLTSDRKTVGPGDTITINIQTNDIAGNALSSDVALWAVDKALFELVDEKPPQIFNTFWDERYDGTQQSHSLEGIIVQQAEMGGGCFAGDTSILMADGKLQPIDTVRSGDSVLTRESQTSNKLITAMVKDTHKTTVSGYFIINRHIRVTPNHRLWINGTWQEASVIEIGDKLVDSHGQSVNVSSIEWLKGSFTVYNLEIEKYKTFFAGGVWVHNQKGGARSIFKDTAYWNPSIHTNDAGRAQVTFKLPDNLTTWVIAGVSDTVDTKVGQSTTEVTVTKDVIVRPIVPNIFRVGDEIVLSALVQNFTQTDQKFDTDLSFDSGEVKDATYPGQLIKSKDSKQLYWHVVPKKENDKSQLTFRASSVSNTQASDTIVQTVPVRPYGFREQNAQTGDGSKTFSIKLSADANNAKSQATFSLSSTILGALPAAMKYLIEYPYGCVEQTTSRFVPAVIAKTNQDLFSGALTGKDIDDIIKKGLIRLSTLQRDDGGWTWWFTGQSDPFITAYVVEYVLAAKQSGIEIDENMLSKAKSYLERTDSQNTLDDKVSKMYALTLLGDKNKVTKITAFDNLTPDLLSLTVLTNVQNGGNNPETNGLSKLIALGKTQGDGIFWIPGNKSNFASTEASTALAIRAILAGGGDRELAVKAARFLIRSKKQQYWSNTFATAQVIRSIVELTRTGSELTPEYTYIVSLDGKQISSGNVTNPSQLIKDISIPAANIKPAGSTLTIRRSGTGQLYSTLILDEFHTDKNAKALNHGISVKREYINEKGEEYSLGVGDTVVVKITLSGLNTSANYGVIEDQLPSGLIPINEELKNEQYGQRSGDNYYFDYAAKEVTENGMVMSLYSVYSGVRTYSYRARVISEGTFSVPPATASLMYAPEVYGRSDAQVVKTTGQSKQIFQKVAQKNVEKYASSDVKKTVILVLITLLGVAALLILKYRKKKIVPSDIPEDQHTENP